MNYNEYYFEDNYDIFSVKSNEVVKDPTVS